MQFNPASGSQGIVNHIDFLVQTDRTKYPLVDIARNVNTWYREVMVWLWEAAGNWVFDDIAATTLPILTTTLVDNQNDYGLPTAAGSEYGDIKRVEVKNSSGLFYTLPKIDQSKFSSVAITEFNKTKGLPRYYELISNSLWLYPAPDTTMVTAAAGLKIEMQRDIVEFASTDTTKEPGFFRAFHHVLAIGAAYDYAVSLMSDVEPQKIDRLEKRLEKLEAKIKAHYTRRNSGNRFEARRVIKRNYS